MRIRPGIFIAVTVAFVVLFGGRKLGWFGSKPIDTATSAVSEQTPATQPADAPAASATAPTPSRPPGVNPTQPRLVPRPPPATQRAAAVPPVAPPTAAVIGDWEEKIDDVLSAQDEDPQKVKRLLEMFPRLPEDGQVEAAQHLSNLTPDEQFASLANILTNAAMPEAVLDVMMTDVLNRPNQLKLEALLDVARTPNHPKAEEARDVLEVFVDENYGDNWAAWKSAVDKWLKENPDE
jgi:hypothetical protein